MDEDRPFGAIDLMPQTPGERLAVGVIAVLFAVAWLLW